jgi:membrane-bound serine protease (ClpP class)
VTTIVVLLILGLLFVVAEVLFPSLGLFGLSSAAALIGADVLVYQEYGGGTLAVAIVLEVIAVPVLVKAALRALPHIGVGRKMFIPAPEPTPSTGIERADHLLGLEGTTESELRPSGTALFGAERRSVVAETGTIAPGTRVRVTAVEGFRIVVRPSDRPADRISVEVADLR